MTHPEPATPATGADTHGPGTGDTAGTHYRTLRTALTALAADLTATDLATAVPALPGWTVHDTYAHVTGVCTDLVTGAPADPTDPAWTDAHVTARRGRPFADVLAEWTDTAPALEAFLDTPEGRPLVIAVFDVYHHTHDIRAAVRRPGDRDTDQTRFVAATMTKLHRGAWAAAGRAPVTITTPTATRHLGDGPAAATLTTTDFELARILIGRRSPAQMRAAGWTGDPAAVTSAIAALPAFGPPADDLHE